MYEQINSKKYKKDARRLNKQGKDPNKLEAVIEKLKNGEQLDPKYKDHLLQGEWINCRDCHIEPDWLLVYMIDEQNKKLYLLRTGSHNIVFNESELKALNNQMEILLEFQDYLFDDEWTEEAINQFNEMETLFQDKILKAIEIFEKVGTKYKNLNSLGNGLYELKPKDVRAYFKYHPDKNGIIIIGLVCLKKTQKAPKQNIKNAQNNISKYLNKENK